MKKISFIVTSYNTEKYIAKCLDSLVFQTEANIEIIVADDNSIDRTKSIILQYANQYSNIIPLFSDKNLGPGGIRNLALDQICGEYVAFVDSDDWVDLNYAEICYNTVQKNDADIATCSQKREYDFSITPPVYKCYYDKEYRLSGEMAFRIMTNEYLQNIKYLPSALNKIYRTEFLKENDLRFIENIYFEDQPFSYETTLAAHKIVCVPNTVYHHYKRNGSIVQSFSKRNVDDMIAAYTYMKRFLVSEDIYDKYVFNFYNSLSHFYNLLVRQIFEFVLDEEEKKEYLKYSLNKLKELIDINEYIDYCSAETLRRHLQPDIHDTTIY